MHGTGRHEQIPPPTLPATGNWWVSRVQQGAHSSGGAFGVLRAAWHVAHGRRTAARSDMTRGRTARGLTE